MKGKRTKECIIFLKKKKKIVTILGKDFWKLLFLFLEFFTFMCMYVLGLIELELSLRLWFDWIMKEEVCSNIWSLLYMCCCSNSVYVFSFWIVKLLIHSFIVHLLIMNNNVIICNHHDMVSMMWSFRTLSFKV